MGEISLSGFEKMQGDKHNEKGCIGRFEDGRDGILFAGNMPLRGCGWREYNCSPVYSAIPPPELFSK